MNTDYFYNTKTLRLQQISVTLSFDLTKINEDLICKQLAQEMQSFLL